MAMHPKYNPDYHDDWAWSLANKGAIDTEIAEAFGISVRTIHRWKQDHPSFAQALSIGKGSADAKVEKALYQRATGYEVEDTEVIQDIDKDGNLKPARIRKLKKHIVPDTMAAIYWLNNRQPRNFKKNPEEFIVDSEEVEANPVQFILPQKEDLEVTADEETDTE